MSTALPDRNPRQGEETGGGMKHLKSLKTLKFRIMAICLTGSLLMTLALGYILVSDLRRAEMDRAISDSRYNLRLMMNNINRDYMQVIRFITWLADNADINRFLAADPRLPSADGLRVTAYNTTQKQLMNLSITDIVDKCVISAPDGRYIALGNIAGDLADYRNMLPHIRRSDELSIQEIIPSPFAFDVTRRVIPVSSRLQTLAGISGSSWADLFLSTKMITNQLIRTGDDATVYLVLAEQLYVVTPQGISEPLPNLADFDSFSGDAPDGETWVAEGLFQGEKARFVFTRSSMNGWMLARRLPDFTLTHLAPGAIRTLLLSILVVFGLSFGILFLLLASINKPVSRICAQLRRISSGDFTKDSSIETDDEIGYIGHGINEMAHDIDRLIGETLETQREKQNFEFRALQSQINPHFLYNTLNSIRWMATIQHADGIAEMTGTLSAMLRRMNATRDVLIPLREELDFIRDYAVIQSYRYGDSFSILYDVQEASCLEAGIIKFTLQPLIENAIFHGIEPKGSPGCITLRAEQADDELLISVIDDGVGMDAERLEAVRRFEPDTDGTAGSGSGGAAARDRIGLSNIHARIRLEFGPAYGLTVESAPGAGTRVMMRLPLVRSGEGAVACTD